MEHSGSYSKFVNDISDGQAGAIKVIVFDLPGHGEKFVTKLDNGTYVAKPEQGYMGSTKAFNEILFKSLMYIVSKETLETQDGNPAKELYLMGHGMGASAVMNLLNDHTTLNTIFKALILSCKK